VIGSWVRWVDLNQQKKTYKKTPFFGVSFLLFSYSLIPSSVHYKSSNIPKNQNQSITEKNRKQNFQEEQMRERLTFCLWFSRREQKHRSPPLLNHKETRHAVQLFDRLRGEGGDWLVVFCYVLNSIFENKLFQRPRIKKTESERRRFKSFSQRNNNDQ
jgi:hypothetical protein